MKTTKMQVAALSAPLMVLNGAALATGGDGWITDMDQAMEIAATESKVILMDFTGSDWCGWCIKLDEEVFSQSMFQEYATKNLVLVELDFPSQKKLSPEQVAHNEKWRDKVGIQGYPTIILADEHGEEFARTGYQPGGAPNYVDHISGLVKGKDIRDAALAAADKLDGIARAKMLDWALSIEGITVPNAEMLMKEIIELDPENLTGLRDTWQRKLNDRMADKDMRELQQKWGSEGPEAALAGIEALLEKYELSSEKYAEVYGMRVSILAQIGRNDDATAAIDEFLARDDMDAEAKQQVAINAVNILLMQGKLDEAVAAFDRAINLDPTSEFGTMLAGQKQDFLNYVNSMRQEDGDDQ